MSVPVVNNLLVTDSSWSSLIPYNGLTNRIRILFNENINNRLSPKEYADLQYGIKLSQGWTWPSSRMKEIFSSASPELIESFMLKMMKEGNGKEIEYYFNCLNLLSEQALLKLSDLKTSDVAAASFKLHGLTKSTALANGMEKESRAILKEFLIEFKQFLFHFLDILISLTGINEVLRQRHSKFTDMGGPVSSYEAKSKIEAYWTLIAYPAVVFGTIYSYLQLTAPALILTSVTVVASLTVLVAYNRYWKPCPLDHEGLKNLSIQVLNESDPVYPRQDILKKIEAAFESKKGVLLVGEPGCGKSLVILSLVKQALEGKICSFIKNPQFFSCNASRFKLVGYDTISLSSVEDRFRKHKEQVVFFLDEFHSFFKTEGLQANTLGDEIKTFWETYKYTIGATTNKEYEEYIKNQVAITGRRFEVIHVNQMDHEQIKTALYQRLGGVNSTIAFDPGVIDYIIQNAKKFNSNTSTIDGAQSLLNYAIKKMKSTVHTDLEEEIAKKEDKLAILRQQGISGKENGSLMELVEKLQNEEVGLDKLKKDLDIKNKITKKMLMMETYLLKLKKQAYLLSNPSINLLKGSFQENEWLKLHARINLVSTFIANERKEQGFPYILNNDLVDTILKIN